MNGEPIKNQKSNKFIDFKNAEDDTLMSISLDHIVAIQEDEPKTTYVYVDVHDSNTFSEAVVFRVKGPYKKIRELIG